MNHLTISGTYYISIYNVIKFPWNISLLCILVTWFKDGKPIDESDSKYKFTLDGKKKYKLEIPNSLLNDIGMYSVKVTSKKGESTAAAALNILTSNDL